MKQDIRDDGGRSGIFKMTEDGTGIIDQNGNCFTVIKKSDLDDRG